MNREPRVMQMPHGGILNVDVTLLQLGLSKVRSTFEGLECQLAKYVALPPEHLGNAEARQILQFATEAIETVTQEVRETLHEVEGEQMVDDVAVARNLDDSEK